MKPVQDGVRAALAGRKVLVVGGLNLDHHIRVDHEPADDGATRVVEYATGGGGHAGNCATALAALGCDTSVFTAVGDDAEGERLLAELARRGIRTRLAVRVAGAATGRVFIPAFPGRRYMLMFRGAGDSWPAAACRSVPFADFAAVVLFDPPRQVLREVLARAFDAGVPVHWNPGGVHAAADWALDPARGVRRLVVNRAECAQLFGEPPDRGSLPGHCLRHGLRRLVVTLGAEGAVATDGESLWEVPARPARVVDPTGAGDAFVAASTAADLAGLADPEALAWGAAAGACAVAVPGARVDGLDPMRIAGPAPGAGDGPRPSDLLVPAERTETPCTPS